MEFTLWTGDLRPFVLKECARANCSPKHFQLEEIKVNAIVTAQPGALEDAMRADPLLLQKMQAAGKQTVEDDLAKLMAYWVGMAETEIGKIESNTQLSAQNKDVQIRTVLQKMPQNLAQTKMQILPKVDASVKRVWEDLCRVRSAYRKYQIQCGLHIAAAAVKITTGAVTAAASAGTALIFGLIGIAATVLKITGELVDMSKEAEKVEKEVCKSVLNVLKKRPDSSKWNTFAASAETIVRKLLPTDLVVDSEVKCKEKNELLGHKLEGLEVKAHDGSVSLNSALEKSDELQQALKQEQSKRIAAAVAATPAPGPGGRRNAMVVPQDSDAQKQITAQMQALTKLEGVINGTIERVIKLSERVEVGNKIHKGFEELIDHMMKNNVPKSMPALAEVVGLLPIIATLEWHKILQEGTVKLEYCKDTIQEVSLELAEKFGPEVTNYAYEKFQKARKKL